MHGSWRFAEFQLDVDNALLTRHGQRLKLRPKSFDVLCYLLEHGDELVTKDELLAALWPGLVVGDTNLHLCLSEIRRVLGEDPRHPRFIETVHRRGYRFHTSPAQAPRQVQSVDAPPASDDDGESLRLWDSLVQSPIVGRDAELARLAEFLDAAHRGQRQTVFVSGEPGIGKTTLVKVFLQGLSGVSTSAEKAAISRGDTPATSATVYQAPLIAYGQCAVQYGAEVAYLPIFEVVGMLVKHSNAALLDSFRKNAPSWVAQAPFLQSGQDSGALPHLAGVTTEHLLREFAEAVEFIAKDRTAVLWIDDLHDSDTASLDLLSYLARRQQFARLLIIGSYRPTEIQRAGHPFRKIQQGLLERSLWTALEVTALSQAAIESLLTLRLPGKIGFSLPSLSQLILTRTEGNPLFVHHVIDDLMETEVIVHRDGQWALDSSKSGLQSRVPANLKEMLLGQIRLLPPPEQEILDVASVMGVRFSIQGLAAVLPRSALEIEEVCERLADEDRFVRRDGEEVWPNAVLARCYRFRHALHQEVTYHHIPILKREAFHQKVGEAKEISHAADIGSVAVELASHFERSRDYQRAIRYCQAGFEQASRRSAFNEGLRLATKGLSLIPGLPDDALRIRAELAFQMSLVTSYAATIGHASEEVGEHCLRALELCKQGGDDIELFPVLCGLFGYYLVKSDYVTALDAGGRLLSIAQRAQSSMLTLAAHVALGMAAWHSGDMLAASTHFEQRAQHYRPADELKFLQFGHDPAVTALSFLAPVYWYLGYPDKARRVAEEGIALARRISHAYTMGIALLFGARPYQECGDIARVQPLVEEHESVCRDQAFTEADARRQLSLGWVLSHQGRPEEGIERIKAGLNICNELGTRMENSYHLCVLARAQAGGGQYDESLRSLAEALRFSQEAGEAYIRAEIYRLRAEIRIARFDHAATGRVIALSRGINEHPDTASHPIHPESTEAVILKSAEEDIRQALAVSREQQARSLELRAAMSLVKLYARMDGSVPSSSRLIAAQDELQAIYCWFSEGLDTPDLREADAILKWSAERRVASVSRVDPL